MKLEEEIKEYRIEMKELSQIAEERKRTDQYRERLVKAKSSSKQLEKHVDESEEECSI